MFSSLRVQMSGSWTKRTTWIRLQQLQINAIIIPSSNIFSIRRSAWRHAVTSLVSLSDWHGIDTRLMA
jgi:hypothetical protein